MNASARTLETSRTAGATLLVLALGAFHVSVPVAARAAAGEGAPGLPTASAARAPAVIEPTSREGNKGRKLGFRGKKITPVRV